MCDATLHAAHAGIKLHKLPNNDSCVSHKSKQALCIHMHLVYASIYIYVHIFSPLNESNFARLLQVSTWHKRLCYDIEEKPVLAGSSSHGWRLELGCQRRLEGVALGLKQQLSDWQLLITATRQNRTVKYYPSPLNFLFFFIFTSSTLNTSPPSPAVDEYMRSPKLHFRMKA